MSTTKHFGAILTLPLCLMECFGTLVIMYVNHNHWDMFMVADIIFCRKTQKIPAFGLANIAEDCSFEDKKNKAKFSNANFDPVIRNDLDSWFQDSDDGEYSTFRSQSTRTKIIRIKSIKKFEFKYNDRRRKIIELENEAFQLKKRNKKKKEKQINIHIEESFIHKEIHVMIMVIQMSLVVNQVVIDFNTTKVYVTIKGGKHG